MLMSGYQVDAGIGWWGKLYDESRRNKVVGEPVDAEALAKVVHDWEEWNDYRILCEGPRIRSWINGVAALDYTEADKAIPWDGLFGVQAHGGGKFLVQFKEITLKELPPTEGAPTWPEEKVPKKDKVKAPLDGKGGARTPEEERLSFELWKGFEGELVASEEQGVGKPVTVTWDGSLISSDCGAFRSGRVFAYLKGLN